MVHELSVQSQVKPVAAAVAREPYAMPRPAFGIIKWGNHDGSGGECYGIVTAVHENCIDAMIFPSNIHQPQPKGGIKHFTDPSLATMKVPNPGGVWRHCPGEQELRDLILQQSSVIERLVTLMKDIETPAFDPEESEFDPDPEDGGEFNPEPEATPRRRRKGEGA